MTVYDLFADLAAEASRPELAWMDSAACTEVGGDIWFPEKGGSSADAKRVCMSCPVRLPCLDYAIDRDERHGIYGGKSERERRRIARARREEAA